MKGRVDGVRGFFLDHVRVTVVRGASGGAAWSLCGSDLSSTCLCMPLRTRCVEPQTPHELRLTECVDAYKGAAAATRNPIPAPSCQYK